MSMLAGPRRKQKVINLRAKNNAWSNDNNKFGQRMLEKMGWSAGKGLGANENGIVDHVVAKYKNDEKGLGFEDKNDQWTKHEDDFNALLANLSNADGDDTKVPSGVSLEVKSKKSKARVHYHKFMRGKDLSRYSKKDLANIFGKKTLKTEEVIERSTEEDIKTTEKIFTEKGSMEDYFKTKLAAIKCKSKILPTNYNERNNADCSFQGFSTANDEIESENAQNGFGFQSFSFYSTQSSKQMKEDNEEYNSQEDTVDKPETKKKNKKRDKDINTDHNDCTEELKLDGENTNLNEVVIAQHHPENVKKSKKKKHLDEENENNYENVLKKKKKRKYKQQ